MTQVLVGFDVVTLVAGYLITGRARIDRAGRRRLLGCAWVLLLIPLYWLLLSLAAWRALFQLVRDPYRWEKTEHGLARPPPRCHSSEIALKSAAASSGRRFMLKGATKRPSLFIR